MLKNPKPMDLVTDWYLPVANPLSGFVYPGPVYLSEATQLADVALVLAEEAEKKGTEEFVIKIDHFVYRGHVISGSPDGPIYALRRVPPYVPTLDELGIERSIQAMLLHKRMGLGGLIILSGETGQGKSTSAAALIKARCDKYGAFCLTVENPPELPLHGRIGKNGVCIQTDVMNGDFAPALRGASRSYPTQSNSILFVGETRDADTAGEVLRIAMNGHLVITTVHASDIIGGMKRFMSLCMANKSITDMEARSLFSSALRLFLHQKLRLLPDGGRRLEIKSLFSADHSSVVANRIRSGSLEGVGTDIQQQSLLIQQGQVDKLLSSFDVNLDYEKSNPNASFSGKSSLTAGLSGLPVIEKFSRGEEPHDPLDRR